MHNVSHGYRKYGHSLVERYSIGNGRHKRVIRIVRDASGQAVLLVLGLLLVISIVPVVVVNQLATQNVPITLQTQDSKAALAAAESGVVSYMAIVQNDRYYPEDYNDSNPKCTLPSNDPAFYLPSNCPLTNGVPEVPRGSQHWVNVTGSNGLNEQYTYTVTYNPPSSGSSSSSSYCQNDTGYTLYVVGRAGTGPGKMTQYRSISVNLGNNLPFCYALFSNYNTASPYVYSNSFWFNSMMQAVNFVLGYLGSSYSVTFDGQTITGAEIQKLITDILGTGPAAAAELGSLFCNYHSYDLNMVSDLLHEAAKGEPTMLANELKSVGLTGISILGWNVGQEIATAIENAVNSAVSYIVGNIPIYGPFPLICNTNSFYGEVKGTNGGFSYGGTGTGYHGGYYGLNTTVSGSVYSLDSLYACGAANLSNANLTFGNASAFKSAGVNPLAGIPNTQFPYLENDLPTISVTWPLGLGTTTFTSGCSGTTAKTTGTPHFISSASPPPTPNFPGLQAQASNGLSSNAPGCQYYGPTFIKLEGSQTQVWSPDGGSNCPSDGGTFTLPQNGVIYVHNWPTSNACVPFPSNFVLLRQDEPIQHHSCYWGDALVQGTLGSGNPQNLTIAASNDIVITGNTTYACGGTSVGSGCKDSLGLVPGGNVPFSVPYHSSSGTYYPQGNVVINHPVDTNGNNNNNCTPLSSSQVNQTVNGTSISCGAAGKGPEIPPPLPSSYAQNCGPGTWPFGGSWNACMYDIAGWLYNIEYGGYYCNLGTEIESVFGAKCNPAGGTTTYTINGHNATADSLAANDGTSNPTAAGYVPKAPSRPSCTPNYNMSFSFSWPPWTLGSCTQQWFNYYVAYGVIGVGQLQQICNDISGLTCATGFEGNLQVFERNWVHGPINSFPAVYDPVVNAVIYAANSNANIQNQASSGNGAAGSLLGAIGGKPLGAIQNGSFTLQNAQAGNQFIQPQNLNTGDGGWQSLGMEHGLGSLTVVGSILEQYNDGLQSAGMITSHFQTLKIGTSSLWHCQIACYVPSGFRNVNLSFADNTITNPPAALINNLHGVLWTPNSIVEVSTGKIVPWAP